MSDLTSFALGQVTRSGLRYFTKPDHILIACPVHSGGQERTPSRKINTTNPRYKPLESYCYACSDDKKTLSWNELAAVTHMAPIRAEEVDSGDGGDDELWLSLPPPEDFYGTDNVEFALHPWKGPWRGISAKMMKRLGAAEVNSRDEPRLYLPVMVDGVEVGNTQCVEDINDETSKIKYLHSGKWTQYTMYPVDIAFPMAEKLKYILLVEGARDALMLVQWGVPAVCIWGTNGWTRAKRDTLLELDVKIVVAMDDDTAGDSAREKINADLKAHRAKVANLVFEDGRDPGKLTREEVMDIGEMFGGRYCPEEDELLNYYLKLRRNSRYARKNR